MKLTVIYTDDMDVPYTGVPITQRQVTITLTAEQAEKLRPRVLNKGSKGMAPYKEKIGPIILTMEDDDE